jgi:hypothetical protein
MKSDAFWIVWMERVDAHLLLMRGTVLTAEEAMIVVSMGYDEPFDAAWTLLHG